jgi:hypothetical protein
MFILDPDLDFLLIPDPGSRGQKDTECRIRIRNMEKMFGLPLPVPFFHFLFILGLDF